jgi:hypothetical protein
MNTAATTMAAISLWQPWASFIAIGMKPYETRHWRAPDRLIGKRIAIHAAKHPVSKEERQWWRDLTGNDEPLPLGAFVCTAVLAAVLRAEDVVPDMFGDYESGRFCWQMDDPVQLEPPVPATGRQGFWLWSQPE